MKNEARVIIGSVPAFDNEFPPSSQSYTVMIYCAELKIKWPRIAADQTDLIKKLDSLKSEPSVICEDSISARKFLESLMQE